MHNHSNPTAQFASESSQQPQVEEQFEGQSLSAPTFGLTADQPTPPPNEGNEGLEGGLGADPPPFQLNAKENEGDASPAPFQLKSENNTGLPDDLKSGVENLSGFSMDDVKVHYNSSEPAQLQAHAFAQGTDIHVAPGQEKHLPEEAWHVTQQKAGRVQPTTEVNGQGVNDNPALETEAKSKGAEAAQLKAKNPSQLKKGQARSGPAVQRMKINRYEKSWNHWASYTTPEQNLLDLEKEVRNEFNELSKLAKADPESDEIDKALKTIEGDTIKDMKVDGAEAEKALAKLREKIKNLQGRVTKGRERELRMATEHLAWCLERTTKSYWEYATLDIKYVEARGRLAIKAEDLGRDENLDTAIPPEFLAEVKEVEKAYDAAMKAAMKEQKDLQALERAKREKEKEAEKAVALKKAQAEEAQRKEEEKLKEGLRKRCDKMYPQLSIYAGGVTELAELLKLVPLGEEGKFFACTQKCELKWIIPLLKRVEPTQLNLLLEETGKGKEEELLGLLAKTKAGQEQKLENALSYAKPELSDLEKILTALDKNAAQALSLYQKAGDKPGKHILQLLASVGNDYANAQALLGTTSGTNNAKDAAIIQNGLKDTTKSTALLDAKGVRGSAKDSLDLLASDTVNDDMTEAVSLLDLKGTGTDALKLIQGGLSLDNARTLLDKPGIRGCGEEVVLVLAETYATVARVAAMLDLRSGKQLWACIDQGKQTFQFVHDELTKNAKQTFWAGEKGGEPVFNGSAKSLDDIISNAVNPPQDGKYAGSNGFGNFGGIDGITGKINMFLPKGVTYKEYDLTLAVKSSGGTFNRGQRRMVVGSDGSRYYTSDHYHTFIKFK